MKSILLVVAVILMIIGGLIGFPAFLSWANVVFSGDFTNAQEIFTRFAIGAIMAGAGQGLWKLAVSLRSDNRSNSNYYGDVYNAPVDKSTFKNSKIRTGGGAFIGGDADSGGGDLVGRDSKRQP